MYPLPWLFDPLRPQRHLLSDETDPFNRAPLTESMLQPGDSAALPAAAMRAHLTRVFCADLELLERIQAYKQSKAVSAKASTATDDVYSS